MKLVDRYITKQFLLTALFGLLSFTVIFVVIDLMEKLDDFLDHDVATPIIFQYYLAFIPEIIKLMTPVAILLSSLFTTGKLSNNNELTAIKASGVSMYRYMTPLVLIAFLISSVFVYFGGWIVPYANQKKFEMERVYLQRTVELNSRTNVYLQDGPRRIVYIGYFDAGSLVGSRVSIQDFSDTNLTRLSQRFDAPQIQWDSVSRSWVLQNGVQRVLTNKHEAVLPFVRMQFTTLHFAPPDIVKKIDKPDELNFPDLRQFIENQQRSGNDVARWMVEYYSKVSFPFASVIVVLFGVPFSFGKRRGGRAVEFGISVAICFIYLFFMKISQVFGYNGDLNPLLTAWLANLIFLAGGIANIIRVEK